MVRGTFLILMCCSLLLLIAPVGHADGGAPNEEDAQSGGQGVTTTTTTASQSVSNPFLFIDVPADHWAVEDLKFLVEYGVITGLPNGAYNGDSYLTRYSAAAMQARALRFLMQHPDMVSQTDLDAIRDLIFQTSERVEENRTQIEAISSQVQGLETVDTTTTSQIPTSAANTEVLSLLDAYSTRLNETEAELSALRLEFEQLKNDASSPVVAEQQINQLKQKTNVNFMIALASVFVGVLGIALATMT